MPSSYLRDKSIIFLFENETHNKICMPALETQQKLVVKYSCMDGGLDTL